MGIELQDRGCQMDTIRFTTTVPPNRRIVIDLPPSTPLEEVEVEVRSKPVVFEVPPPVIDPRLIQTYIDPVTGIRHPVSRTGVVREVRE